MKKIYIPLFIFAFGFASENMKAQDAPKLAAYAIDKDKVEQNKNTEARQILAASDYQPPADKSDMDTTGVRQILAPYQVDPPKPPKGQKK